MKGRFSENHPYCPAIVVVMRKSPKPKTDRSTLGMSILTDLSLLVSGKLSARKKVITPAIGEIASATLQPNPFANAPTTTGAMAEIAARTAP